LKSTKISKSQFECQRTNDKKSGATKEHWKSQEFNLFGKDANCKSVDFASSAHAHIHIQLGSAQVWVDLLCVQITNCEKQLAHMQIT